MTVHAVDVDDLAGLRVLAVAALLGREIDDDRAGLHQLDHVLEPQLRRRLARDQRGRDDDVDFLRLRAEQRVLGVEELLAHLLRVAALPFARLLDRDGQELAAERLHLLLGGGAHVERAHDRAEALRRAERREPGDARADDRAPCRAGPCPPR